MHDELVVDGPLRLGEGIRTFDRDTFVNGWIELTRAARLEVNGTLRCWSLLVEGHASVRCRALIANVVRADNSSGRPDIEAVRIDCDRIDAIVVSTTQCALRGSIAAGSVHAVYLQHWGGDLNPSWDYRKGDLSVLKPEVYEPGSDPDGPVLIHELAIRRAFEQQGSPLTCELRVVPRAPPRRPSTNENDDPVVAELAAWLDAHPGPQRATMDDLVAQWLPRLRALPEASRVLAAARVAKKLKSPKLAAAVGALRRTLTK